MKRRDTFEAVLDQCLERIAAGDSIEACLRDFPQHAAALGPLLEAAARLHALDLPTLSRPAHNAARARAHAAFVAQRSARGVGRSGIAAWWPGSRFPRFAMALALLFTFFGGGVAAAQNSLPGDSLYG